MNQAAEFFNDQIGLLLWILLTAVLIVLSENFKIFSQEVIRIGKNVIIDSFYSILFTGCSVFNRYPRLFPP